MIVLDTNVVSTMMQENPDPQVRSWLDTRSGSDLWTTAITIYEIEVGIRRLDAGARRDRLQQRFTWFFDEVLGQRVLALDARAAACAGALAVERSRSGLSQAPADTLIAGIVLAHDATLATRNIRHFQGVKTVDPWTG